MIRTLPPLISFALILVTAAALTGCGSDATEIPPTEVAEVPLATETPAPPPTVVTRLPTPTIDPAEQPLAPVKSEELPGVVLPAAAVLEDFDPATDDEDAVAAYVMPDADADTLYDWYLEHMPAAGWDEGEDRDGTLIFLHLTELSARFAEEGLKRTATVFFDTADDVEDGTGFTLIVESPAEE